MSTTQALSPFHLAFPVHSLKEARSFYGDILGCAEGRSSPEWIDFNFYGHQIVAHLAPEECQPTQTSEVDNEQVPVRHFGIVMDMPSWQTLADRLQAQGLDFIIAPPFASKGSPESKPRCSCAIPQAMP